MRDKASDAVSHRAIARDITARKRAETALINARERAEYASQAKSRFLATVSHEIRTPMNGIMGMAKLLADTKLSPEQRTYVGAVSTSASALLALIEDLLDYSKIEAGRFDAEPQPMSLREIADNVVELLAARAFAKDIGIGCHVAPDVPQMITADPGRRAPGAAQPDRQCHQVHRHRRRAGRASTAAASDNERPIRFTVTDTGPGLQPRTTGAHLRGVRAGRRHARPARMAAPASALPSPSASSTAMGGTISRHQPSSGKGSEFAFEIPRRRRPRHRRQPPAHVLGRRAVISVEERVEAEAIARTIRAHGGAVDIAATAAQAAPLAEGCDALLVDAALEDGRRQAAQAPAPARLRRLPKPITLIAPTDRGMLGEFRASGYATFLARPVRGETLLRVLSDQACARRSPSRAPDKPRPPSQPRHAAAPAGPVGAARRGQRHQRHAGARHACQGRASRRQWSATARPRSRPSPAPAASTATTWC